MYALDEARAVVVQVQPKHMQLLTPYKDWQVAELLQHMLYELSWVPDIVMNETIALVGDRYEGDLLGDDPGQAWHRAYIQAREAVRRCNPASIAHLSYGDTNVRTYLEEAAIDQLAHGWDLGRAIGIRVVFDDTIAQEMLAGTRKRRGQVLQGHVISKSLHVPETASVQTKLLAALGRNSNWQS